MPKASIHATLAMLRVSIETGRALIDHTKPLIPPPGLGEPRAMELRHFRDPPGVSNEVIWIAGRAAWQLWRSDHLAGFAFATAADLLEALEHEITDPGGVPPKALAPAQLDPASALAPQPRHRLRPAPLLEGRLGDGWEGLEANMPAGAPAIGRPHQVAAHQLPHHAPRPVPGRARQPKAAGLSHR